VLGGTVSSQHAGLACPDWPACNGEWLPPIATLAGIQMLHRYVAYLLAAAMVVAALASRSTRDRAVRAGAKLALSLTCAQIVLGVCNVLLGTPPWLSALHIATAAAILAAMVAVTCRVALLPLREAIGASVAVAPAELPSAQASR
jgi:heme A synthase